MNFLNVEELVKLCPNLTELTMYYFRKGLQNLESIEIVSKFQNLKSLTLEGGPIPLKHVTNYLKLLKNERKLERIKIDFNVDNETKEFFKTLIENVNLKVFDARIGKLTKMETEMISTWIENNTVLQNIQLNCTIC
jgi:DNA replication protein DnaD